MAGGAPITAPGSPAPAPRGLSPRALPARPGGIEISPLVLIYFHLSSLNNPAGRSRSPASQDPELGRPGPGRSPPGAARRPACVWPHGRVRPLCPSRRPSLLPPPTPEPVQVQVQPLKGGHSSWRRSPTAHCVHRPGQAQGPGDAWGSGGRGCACPAGDEGSPAPWLEPSLLKGPVLQGGPGEGVRAREPLPAGAQALLAPPAGRPQPRSCFNKTKFSFCARPPAVKGPIYGAEPPRAAPPTLRWRWPRPVIYSFNLAHSRWASGG